MVEVLIYIDTDIKCIDCYRQTSLVSPALVKLLDHGSNIYVKDSYGNTTLLMLKPGTHEISMS